MKICFISVAIHFLNYQFEIGERLRERGHEVFYVTYSKECANFLKSKLRNHYYVPDFKPNLDNLDKTLKKYGLDKDELLVGDIDVSHMKKEKAYDIMHRDFLFWEDILRCENPDMVIGSAERLAGLVPYYVCENSKTRYYFWTRSVLPNRFVLSTESITGRIPNIKIKEQLTEEELTRAKHIVREIRINKHRVYLVVGEPVVNKSLIYLFFNRMIKNIFVERFKNPYARLIGIAL